MRSFLIFVLCKVFVTGVSGTAFCQAPNQVSATFSNVSFPQFVQQVERAVPCRFYYDANALDSFRVNAVVTNVTLPQLLQQVFQNTMYHFAIDAMGNVLVTKQLAIETKLPAGFFDRSKAYVADTMVAAVAKPKPLLAKVTAAASRHVYEIGSRTDKDLKSTATVAGYVRNSKTGEPVVGASVFADSLEASVLTDQYGYYSLKVLAGRHQLHVSGVGMSATVYELQVYANGNLDIQMQEFIPSLKNVVVYAERNSNIRQTAMGIERLTIQTIKQVPVVFGEADVLRVILTLPGVTSVGEASTGFNVRGGAADQNLILFSDATIYNPSHLFGFFSAFNADVVKGVELFKSAIPEKYGGRLSSVLEVSTRDGNAKKISGVGGIGLLTSKLTLEGPIAKDKTTFIVGGRTTYSNWLLKQVPNASYKNSKASFYDLDVHLTHTINNRNTFYLAGYTSNDAFNFNNDTAYSYGNKNVNLKWKHIFNNQLHGIFITGYDEYQYAINGSKESINAYKLAFSIQQAHMRADFIYAPNNKHALNFGVNAVHYTLRPGSFTPTGTQSLVKRDVLAAERGLESAVYAGDQYAITTNLSVHAGIRYSVFQFLGPGTIYKYADGIPKTPASIYDSVQYANSNTIKTYHGPEYRFSMRYVLTSNASLKASVNSLRQYIHTLSNSTAVSPTDIWKLSDPNIRPQQGFQVAMGYYRNFKSNSIETSIEVYYKRLRHYLDYKSGATLLMNHHIEADVINTKGKAMGAEFLVKKTTGKINGWVSYTYARTWLKMDDAYAGETINRGAYYPANFDKPHAVNFISNYRFSHRVSLSLNVIYNTGRPITLPLAVFELGGAARLYYSERNQYRIPDYFRTDLSMNLEGNHKIKQFTHNSWSFGVYNLTGRQNAYSVYFVQQAGAIKGYKLSIFGAPIPFVTYNFKF